MQCVCTSANEDNFLWYRIEKFNYKKFQIIVADKFLGKYRIPSARARWWDYGGAAAYFVTVCVKNMSHYYFGKIVNNEMQLSEIGKKVEEEWLKSFELRPDMNLTMDVFKVMPNHFHAIIVIGENEFNFTKSESESETVQKPMNSFSPQSKNLGSIMRGFKGSVTRFAQKIEPEFDWQERFHDHIIRDEQEFIRISNYIETNPAFWKKDKFISE
jgi:putative transposase